MGSQGGFGQSKDFLDFIKSIGETRSKSEEDRIILREIETLKRRIVEPDIPKRKMKDYIIRLVYVEMLGHDASFGYIHAVKMTHDDSLSLKRTGYLAVMLFLNEEHDLIILIVNTIQKDLKSDNYLVVSAALNAVCRLINEETIPAVLPQVVELLGHQKEAVRKKSLMALHRFYQKSPSSVSHLISNFRKRLCDNDPGVMGAALCPLFDLVTTDVNSYKDLVNTLVSILKQVTERRLPKSFDYHHTPAPFIQIKLLKILALLGNGDKRASEQMYTVVGDLFRKCDASTNIGNAVLYECICCVSSIYPNTKLLEAAAEAISKFLKSDSHNLKYMGIDALGRLIKISLDIAEQHQLAVIDCLEDPDETLKRKTFELLHKMTKSSNVEVIVDRMIGYMISINDSHYKTEIASRCVELAEQFAPSNHWFIQTMNKVFEHAGDLVDITVAHNLMRLIAEGFGEDDDTVDGQLRSSAVESYLRIVTEPKLPSAFLQVICWVLGEYGTADGIYSASYITGKLCDVSEAYSNDETVKAYAISSITKIYAFEIAAGRKLDILPECQSLIEELSTSHSTDMQQRAYELQAVIALNAQAAANLMPSDASSEEIEIDKNLPFLDYYVQQALQNGAQPYIIPEEEHYGMPGNFRSQEQHESSMHSLKFEAYELPPPPPPPTVPQVSNAPTELVPVERYHSSRETQIHSSTVHTVSNQGSADLKLRLDGVQKKWGRPSYSESTSDSAPTNGVVELETTAPPTIRPRESSRDSRRPQEISPEKQKLAASLFGGSSKTEKRGQSSGHKVSKTITHTSVTKTPSQPLPDLLDLGGTTTNGAPSMDPFEQLETLAEHNGSTDVESPLPSYGDSLNLLSGSVPFAKGSNLKDALEKDALVRQMGVTPTSQNPSLFKDLLG